MKKIIPLIYLTLIFSLALSAQKEAMSNKQNVILITLDGLRWQELFTGADKELISNKDYVENTTELSKLFWKDSSEERRKALMPFIWNTVKEQGQIHGNRTIGSKMNLTNKHWFSYPGYNEILSGVADDKRITSNAKIPNPNQTILEIANNSKGYKGHVAAFGSWDVFQSIINETRSQVPVNAGFDTAEGLYLTSNETYLNKLQKETPSPWGSVRLDVFTHNYAIEYMKKKHPKLMYIAYGETDDFAHDGDYESYLKAAERADNFIEELWGFVETDPFYKGNTTFIITTDHGRGTEPIDTWRSHGKDIIGSDQVWVVVFGTKIKPIGEVKSSEQLFTNQIAASIAKLLGIEISDARLGKSFEFIKN
jgi:hypothetical protein